MNWFRENPFWGWLAVVAGAALVLALGLLWWSKGNFDSAQQDYDGSAATLHQLESSNPYPSAANTRKMQVYLENYRASLAKLKTELATEVAPVVPLAPNEFQTRLRQAIAATAEDARAQKVKLPEHFNLGFDEFMAALPGTAEAPKLGQELRQVQLLLSLIIDARVDAIKMFHRVPRETPPAPGPIARPGTATPPPGPIERNVVEFTVAASPSAARKLINQIAAAKEQFFLLRTIHVKNETIKGPSREGGPTPASAAAANPAPAKPAAAATPPPPALTFIVGNEHIDLSARVELVTFAF